MSVRCLLLAALVPVALLAQPQGRVVWSFEGNDGVYDAIAIPDVSGDSLPDVVAAMYYGAYPTDPRKLYCCSGATGDTIWVNRTAYGTWGNKGLDVSPDRRTLYVHAMATTSPDDLRREIRDGFERRILEVFR